MFDTKIDGDFKRIWLVKSRWFRIGYGTDTYEDNERYHSIHLVWTTGTLKKQSKEEPKVL